MYKNLVYVFTLDTVLTQIDPHSTISMSDIDTPTPSHSTSFDSSNSFYSTTDSNSASSLLQLSSSMILDEEFYDPQYREVVDSKVRVVVAEIADDANFVTIVSLPAVTVETSSNPLTPFCFRASATFPANSAPSAFALFADIQQRAAWDAMCQEIVVLRTIDPLTFIYHLKLKATWPTTPRDSLMMAAFRKLKDGRFISVAWSIEDDQLCPPCSTHIRMHTRISANLFTPLTPTSFQLTQLIDADPKGSIPSYLIKKVSATSFPATIDRIKAAIDPQAERFYSDLFDRETDTYDSRSAASNSAQSTAELRDIQRRLGQIEAQLREQQQSKLTLWAPIALSTLSVILLLNLTLRKRPQ